MEKGFLTTNNPEKDIYKTLDEIFKGLKHDEIIELIDQALTYLTI